uniref:DDE_3 domain-containing protein n=1 Tax=Steinernema glaseri TaxID=37863 RepID=A0A1I7Y1E9_9BILA
MPFPSKRKVAGAEALQKGRDTLVNMKKDEEQRKWQALIEENRLLRERLEQREKLEEEQLSPSGLPRLGTGQTLCDKTKAVVCRVLQFARKYCEKNALEWTSAVTGIRKETLRNYEKEIDIKLAPNWTEEGKVIYKLPPCSSVQKTSFKERVVNSIDDDGKRLIEQAVDQIHRTGKPVTLKKLHEILSPDLLSGSLLTVKKLGILLHHMKYSHRLITNRAVLFDNDPVIEMRKNYTRIVRQLRDQGYQMFYLDETWVFQGMTHKRDWQSHYTPAEKKKKQLSSGPTAPPDHGKRAIVVHTVGRDGLVEGALKIMLGRKKDGDYHREMNAQVFEEYIKNLIPLLKAKGDKIALIMDNASYHSRCLERIPTMADRKEIIRQFLREHAEVSEEVLEGSPKRILMSLVKEHVEGREQEFRRKAVDELCKANGIKLLRLPPYHANFNPIELVWGWTKSKVREIATMGDNITRMEQLTRDVMDKIPLNHIQRFFDHVINEENEWEAYDNFNPDDLGPIFDDNDGGDHE